LDQDFFFKLSYNPRLKPFIGLLAYLEPKLWPTNPIFDKNKKVKQKVSFAIAGKTLANHNSAAD